MLIIFILVIITLIITFANTIYFNKGEMGEKAVGSELSWANLRGAEGLTLFNVYVPMNIGKTTEIDLLYIFQLYS